MLRKAKAACFAPRNSPPSVVWCSKIGDLTSAHAPRHCLQSGRFLWPSASLRLTCSDLFAPATHYLARLSALSDARAPGKPLTARRLTFVVHLCIAARWL